MRKVYRYLLVATLCGVFIQTSAVAQQTSTQGNPGPWFPLGVATVAFFLLLFLVVVLFQMMSLNRAQKGSHLTFKQWWAEFSRRVLTKSVAVEQEQDILLDHDYDGIKELDNALPPWWKYGFYFTIIVGVIYLLRFHVFHAGPSPEEEYNTEMRIAAIQVDEYRKKSNDMVDEKTVTLGDAASAERGMKIFTTVCFACHGAHGEGGVGPNLTDNYWLHGGSINEIFHTIKYGVPEKGMQSWQKTYSPSQIRDLATFIKSLKGTNPANEKAPQGDLFVESATGKKDSVTKK